MQGMNCGFELRILCYLEFFPLLVSYVGPIPKNTLYILHFKNGLTKQCS